MAGKRTHEQELRIIEKRENTTNAGDDFDPSVDLKKSRAVRARERGSPTPQKPAEIQGEDRAILRGVNQESKHHKPKGGH
ncbi:hypothetical protein AM571_PC02023 (plasmid) [Rhizobium etli 8C-3]|uniref:Uncharacterized protein n=2 Tax=Rhizobium TaxID=379 RepID=A0A4R3RYP0_9HYPH|nr:MULTISPECIES: hypothetical protein [Rhizobium]APO79752.1 hypothetical protein AM571_PC02023 [Rhizobium etli 8C-3]TCU30547.1 hypothetical protein EV130_101118 [Rhizobium azibense]TCU41443.1 hypothetical protein EV129_101734 [Rhizobium azibense]